MRGNRLGIGLGSIVAVVFLAGLALPPCARAEVLSGRVLVGDEGAASAAVILERADGGADSSPASSQVPAPRTVHLDEVWISFVPKVQVVPVGSTVILRNLDDELHTVHGWSRHRTEWNRAVVPSGPGSSEQRVELPRAGAFTVTCDVHPEMRGTLVVTRQPHHAVADREGRFTVDGVPPGRYRVRVVRADRGALPDDELPDAEPGELLATVTVPAAAPLLLHLAPVAAAPAPSLRSPASPPFPPSLPSQLRDLLPRAAPAHLHLFPRSLVAVGALCALGLILGHVLAYLLSILVEIGGSALHTILAGGALAVLAGLTFLTGLHPAISTALGVGLFVGSTLFIALPPSRR